MRSAAPMLALMLVGVALGNAQAADGANKGQKLPAAYDSRKSSAHSNLNLVSPVQDQGNCSATTAFALVAVAESTLAAALNRSAVAELSAHYLHFCNRIKGAPIVQPSDPTGGSCDKSLALYYGIMEVNSYGFRWRECWPYDASRGNATCDAPAAKCQANAKLGDRPAGGFQSTFLYTPEKVKAHIMEHGAVVGSFFINRSQWRTSAELIKATNGKGKNDAQLAWAIIGWDDKQKVWIAKSSWGTKAGNKGFYKVTYANAVTSDQVKIDPAQGLIYYPPQ